MSIQFEIQIYNLDLIEIFYLTNSRKCYTEHGRGSSYSQLKANPTPFKKKQEEKQRETKKKKLEDYLDPVLLAAISSKISGRAKSKREDKDFDCPVDKLKVFMEDSSSRTEKRKSEAVNLDDDLDLIDDSGDRECCTPFWRFEQTALKRFKDAGY